MTLLLATLRRLFEENKLTLFTLIVFTYLTRKLIPLTQSKTTFTRLITLHPQLQPCFLVNRQGLQLYYRQWNIERSRAIVFICHGYAEHSGRYEHLAQRLNKEGYSVYALDHQGCGQSQGTRAYIEHFSDYVEDFIQFRHYVDERLNNDTLPRFLFAHSIGGVIGIQVMCRCAEAKSLPQWQACILSAPAIAPQNATAVNRILARLFSTILPKFGIEKLDSRWVSRIESVVQRYDDDFLNYHGKIRARYGQEVIQVTDYIQQHMAEIQWPFLLVHGEADHISNIQGSDRFFSQVNSTDKTFKRYEGAYHELINDLNSKQVQDDCIEWINNRIQTGTNRQ